ncbi:MAG: hypothetical protein EOO01_41995, partial [Chitinophagaceae bacterium]
MMSETKSKKNQADLVSVQLAINGETVSAAIQLLAIEVQVAYNKISSARINIADGDAAQQDFPLSSREEKFLPGNTIELKMGY